MNNGKRNAMIPRLRKHSSVEKGSVEEERKKKISLQENWTLNNFSLTAVSDENEKVHVQCRGAKHIGKFIPIRQNEEKNYKHSKGSINERKLDDIQLQRRILHQMHKNEMEEEKERRRTFVIISKKRTQTNYEKLVDFMVQHEYLVQVLILLPVILMVLYILFVEKGPLYSEVE